MKTFIDFLDRLEDLFLLIVFLLLFLVGLYAMYDSYLVYAHANDSSILKFRPGHGGEDLPDKQIRGRMAAWITVPDTTIDYPVMQGDDNSEYLNKDPFGDYSLSGSIFLDSRNSPDFTDDYSLIYGHHMEGGSMFGALDAFLEEDYFRQHQEGRLTAGNVSRRILFFAVVKTKATDPVIFAPTEAGLSEVLDSVREHEVAADEKAFPQETENVRLVALSTCQSPDTIDRVILFGRLY